MDYQRIVEDIKAQIDIADLISGYVDIKRAGKNYKALCPFHSEKTPSFTISPDKQIFHCFGCGVGGDIIGFIMKEEGMDFIDAVRFLAKKAGIDIGSDSGTAKESSQTRDTALNIQKHSFAFFMNALKESKTASEYILQRGITPETIDKFSIGFAPKRRDTLYRYLKESGISDRDITDSGIVKFGDTGPYDFFRNRIIFPILNFQGTPVAFGGRVIDESMPKYINSPETVVFKKRRTLFGLNLAKGEITKKGYVILVEGYMDAIICYQYGFKNVTAPLGTSLTEEHIRLINRFTKNTVLIFDSDSAGIYAAKRALDLLFRNALNSKVVMLPPESDPDSFLKSHGAEEFQKLLSTAQGYIDFILSVDGNNLDSLRDVFGTLSNIKDPILKSKLVSELSDKASISETILREELKRVKYNSSVGSAVQKTHIKSADEILLGIYLAYPEMAETIKEKLSIDGLENPLIKKVFEILYSVEERPSINNLYSICNRDEIAYISGLMIDLFIDKEKIDKNIEDCIINIKKRNISKAIDQLEKKIKMAESSNNDTELKNLLIEKQNLIRQKTTINK